ncbi:tRNA(Met) cytidine acetyltransferase TmcA [Halosegnis longus]|uniref:tRNA(Met) cytidine acetyltransferase TmcA n=1 Tax=Halosegnis longus TaxID=2216012 RepID=A0AAJ4UVS9_9EURY|nr:MULTISPECIES: tRNA(Met) cytidine acetyltransferase TmcA [Halobacteriales]RNJ26225.1 tRNA(Met) cytidine acetyltransferase [Salella cibi]
MDATVRALREEARTTNERRALLVHGSREHCYAAARRVLEAADIDGTDTTCLSDGDICPAEHLRTDSSDDLLGRTREAVVADCHDSCRPNALGRAVGAVDGGGLLLVLAPPLDAWPTTDDSFTERLAIPPFERADVTGRFRERLAATMRAHRGIAVYDADAETWAADGRTHPAPRRPTPAPDVPDAHDFPAAVYEACLTADQRDAVHALEALRDPDGVVVVEADRGRGKSAAAGLAAAALAAEGNEVLVTAPGYQNAAEVFDRAETTLRSLDAFRDRPAEHPVLATNGRIRYAPPPEAVDDETADVILVDEAAAVPVRILQSLVETEVPIAFTTTVHGYEGAGRGFDVRFRDWLRDTDRTISEPTLADPIRYAPCDPIEVWAFRALCFDARPPVAPLVADATPETTEYVQTHPDALLADEHLLRETFGLLVAAHYRTEPDDLARLLDGPNLTVRALRHEGHVVAVALLGWEGGLSPGRCERMYEGERVPGNMLPDLLTSQLRDPEAGLPRGLRVVRIAVHERARDAGLGTKLLDSIREEFSTAGTSAPHAGNTDARDPLAVRHERAGGPFDYLGVGFGATPPLLRFWRAAGYRTVHLSTTRNDRSGEHSTLLVHPLTEAGDDLLARNDRWFRRRIGSVLADGLAGCEPAIVAGTLRAVDGEFSLDLTQREWRAVAAAAYGPGHYDFAPRPFQTLALRGLADGVVTGDDAALLVAKALQCRPWEEVADDLDYVSTRQCALAFGEAMKTLLDAYGTETVARERARYQA